MNRRSQLERRINRVSHRLAAVFVAASLLVPPSSQLAAQDPHEGLPIREVEFEGLTTLAEETLLFYLGLERGRPLDTARLNEATHQLWERGLVDDIEIEAYPEGDGVRLLIRVDERPILRSVEYEGLKRVSRTEITERIAKDRIAVREGDSLRMGELQRLRAVIEEMYRQKGYRFAKADLRLEELGPEERRAVFTIDEGDRVRIADISFEGNEVFRGWRLQWVMKKTAETGLISRILKKDVFNAANLQEDLESIRDLYRAAGYKDVAIGEPHIEIRAKRPDAPTAKKQKRRLHITIPIDEGERWQLGEISIDGNERFTDQLLLRQFKRPKGGWLRSKVIDEGIESIDGLYRNTGHLFADIETELRERGENVADLLVHIREGDQFRVGRIEFEGNTRTRDKVLRRELRVQEGLVLNVEALRNSLRKIGQLEYFRVDDNDPVAFDFDTEEKQVDLTIKGEEGDRTELMFGGGWSEIDGFFGQASARTRNFLGRGETVGVSLQTGRFRTFFDLSYFAPWFLDRPQSFGIQAFSRNIDFTLLSGQTFLQDTQGATITYGRNLGLFQSVAVSYSFFEAEDRRRLINLDGETFTQEFSREVSSIRPVYIFDNRDSRLNPTVGRRLTASVEYAGGVLGGTTYFVRPQAAFSLFKPVTKSPLRTVFAVNAEAGFIEPFGGRELFFFDRFYLGGENNLRGFRFRSVWVRDKDGNTVTDDFGFPLGGEKFMLFNVEYHFLMGGPFRILLFTDAGNVYSDDQSVDLGRLRYTAGAELRVFVPIFGAPLRFIYARNLDPLPDDRFESFQFSIGSSF